MTYTHTHTHTHTDARTHLTFSCDVFGEASVDVIQSRQQIPVLNLHHLVERQQRHILLKVWECIQLEEKIITGTIILEE